MENIDSGIFLDCKQSGGESLEVLEREEIGTRHETDPFFRSWHTCMRSLSLHARRTVKEKQTNKKTNKQTASSLESFTRVLNYMETDSERF